VLRKLPALATSALIAAGLVAGPTAAGAANADTTTIPSRSGLGWASGVYIPGDNTGAVESFGTWRGAKTDVSVTWPARSNWNDVTNSTWIYDRWRNAPQTLVLGLPPFPENVGATMDACANGSYDAQWRQFGTTIKNYGLSDRTIIRLGWEFNGNWYAWSARNPGHVRRLLAEGAVRRGVHRPGPALGLERQPRHLAARHRRAERLPG
jgi:hypothetical protein